jgi:hypothetical protein
MLYSTTMHATYLLVLLVFSTGLFAQRSTDTIPTTESFDFQFSGQLAGWGGVQQSSPSGWMAGGRFVPSLTGSFSSGGNSVWDMETSLNINGGGIWLHDSLPEYTGRVKPYRVWFRYSTPQFELRAGLQKMNFGAAKLLRPLMWFDGMDIRDPLQLTDGVYGLLSRYYFDSNSTLWAWVLAGNHRPKGYEWAGTARWKPETGGRFQIPLGPGEVGVNYHYREVDPHTSLLPIASPIPSTSLSENRIGFDGKWDIGVGLWVEGSLTTLEKVPQVALPSRTDMLNLGLDYTFPLGNGVGFTFEYFRYHTGNRFFTGGAVANVLATMVNYPLSLIDNLSMMVFCLPSPGGVFWMNYLSWSRTYDQLSVYVIGFLNPEEMSLPVMSSQGGSNVFTGKGLQLMLSYNF